MRISLSLAATVALLALAGCASRDDDHSSKGMAMKDACAHCAGQQTLTASGTCSACGMAVDVCSMCPGDQKLTAGKTCSGCGMKVM